MDNTGLTGGPHVAGMTLRDHFAGLAMQGLLTNNNALSDDARLAKSCYEIADAMLAHALEQPTDDTALKAMLAMERAKVSAFVCNNYQAHNIASLCDAIRNWRGE